MIISFIRSLHDTEEPEQVEVADLAALETELLTRASDEKGGAAWIAGPTLGRTDAHVSELHVWTLDYDGAEPDWDKLGAWNYTAHTTHSHSAERPSWRVIVELSEPVSGSDWKAAYKAKLALHELKASVDGKTCNPSRIWYTPSPDAQWRENDTGWAASMQAAPTTAAQPVLDANALQTSGKDFWPQVEQTMRALPPSISGQSGHDRLFEAAAVCRVSFLLEPQAAFEALQIFNQRCQPAWSDEELWHKVSEGQRDTQHTPGELVPKQLKAALEREAGLPAEDSLFIDTAFDTPDKLRFTWTCEDLAIIPGRCNMLFADPHCGKTTVQAELALAFATGTLAFGRYSVGPPRQVLCLECEDDFDLRHHIGLFKRDRALSPEMLMVTRKRMTYLDMVLIADMLRQKPGIVFLNSLRAFTPGLEENSSEFAEPLIALAELSRQHDVPIWVNHHTNKAGGVRGTSAIAAASGNCWTLTKDEDGLRIMRHTAHRMCFERKAFAVQMKGSFLVSTDIPKKSDDPELDHVMQDVQALLKAADRWVKEHELKKRCSSKRLPLAIDRLLRQNIIALRGESRAYQYHWNINLDPKG